MDWQNRLSRCASEVQIHFEAGSGSCCGFLSHTLFLLFISCIPCKRSSSFSILVSGLSVYFLPPTLFALYHTYDLMIIHPFHRCPICRLPFFTGVALRTCTFLWLAALTVIFLFYIICSTYYYYFLPLLLFYYIHHLLRDFSVSSFSLSLSVRGIFTSHCENVTSKANTGKYCSLDNFSQHGDKKNDYREGIIDWLFF